MRNSQDFELQLESRSILKYVFKSALRAGYTRFYFPLFLILYDICLIKTTGKCVSTVSEVEICEIKKKNLWTSFFENFGIELFSQEVPLQVFSPIYNVSQLSSRWISVVPLNTLETPKQNPFQLIKLKRMECLLVRVAAATLIFVRLKKFKSSVC